MTRITRRYPRRSRTSNPGGTAAEFSPAPQRDLFGCPPPSGVQASPEHGQFSSLHQMAAAIGGVEHPDLLSQRILSWACPDAGHAPYEVVPCCAESFIVTSDGQCLTDADWSFVMFEGNEVRHADAPATTRPTLVMDLHL